MTSGDERFDQAGSAPHKGIHDDVARLRKSHDGSTRKRRREARRVLVKRMGETLGRCSIAHSLDQGFCAAEGIGIPHGSSSWVESSDQTHETGPGWAREGVSRCRYTHIRSPSLSSRLGRVEAQMLKQGGVLLELSDPLQLFPREVEATISDMKGPRFNAELLEIPAERDPRHDKLGLGL